MPGTPSFARIRDGRKRKCSSRMAKTTITYWNPLEPDCAAHWEPIEGLEGMADELTLSIDEKLANTPGSPGFSRVQIQRRLAVKAMNTLKKYSS